MSPPSDAESRSTLHPDHAAVLASLRSPEMEARLEEARRRREIALREREARRRDEAEEPGEAPEARPGRSAEAEQQLNDARARRAEVLRERMLAWESEDQAGIEGPTPAASPTAPEIEHHGTGADEVFDEVDVEAAPAGKGNETWRLPAWGSPRSEARPFSESRKSDTWRDQAQGDEVQDDMPERDADDPVPHGRLLGRREWDDGPREEVAAEARSRRMPPLMLGPAGAPTARTLHQSRLADRTDSPPRAVTAPPPALRPTETARRSMPARFLVGLALGLAVGLAGAWGWRLLVPESAGVASIPAPVTLAAVPTLRPATVAPTGTPPTPSGAADPPPSAWRAPVPDAAIPERALLPTDTAPVPEAAVTAAATVSPDQPTGSALPPGQSIGDAVSSQERLPGPFAAAPEARPSRPAAGTAPQSQSVPILPEAVLHLSPGAPLLALGEVRSAFSEAGVVLSGVTTARFGVPQSEVRFFHDADGAEARRLAEGLGGRARDFTGYEPRPDRGVMEVWLAPEG